MNIMLQIESMVGRTLCIYLVCEQASRGAVWRQGGNIVLLPNDICCSLPSFAAIALKNLKVMTENFSQLNALVLITEPP